MNFWIKVEVILAVCTIPILKTGPSEALVVFFCLEVYNLNAFFREGQGAPTMET